MKITILGAGAYALGLAYRLNNNKNKVTMWSKVPAEIETLEKYNKNEKALPGVTMKDGMKYTTSMKDAMKSCDVVIIAVATKFIPSVCLELSPYLKDAHVVIASKGIEEISTRFASDLVRTVLCTNRLCTISGPSFAKDMASEDVIGLSLAATNRQTRKIVINAFKNTNIKIRPTNDFVGVELCGTMKNIIAVASGILDGLKVSESTKAMFLTESVNDVRKLIKKMGGNEKTILSFAGFGDILLTCTSLSSRNYSYGKMIGEKTSKKKLDDFLKNNTVEGVYTLKSLYNMIKSKRIKFPFLDLIYQVSFDEKSPDDIIFFLMEKE